MTDDLSERPSERAKGMLCPVCKVDLMLADRQGIEIDYCPQCRGVWLDRGELDKIIERNASYEASAGQAPLNAGYQAPAPPYPPAGPWEGHEQPHHGGGHGRGGHGGRGHGGGYQRGGFLGGLFRH